MEKITRLSVSDLYPVQKFRYCPVCGSDSFLPDMQKSGHGGFLYPHSYSCAGCGFLFFINAAASTMALLIDPEGKVLMLKRMREPKKGTLDLPGGFLEPGERAEDGMKREVHEETNLHVASFQIYNKTYCNEYFFGGFLYQTLDLVFICRVDNWSDLQANDPEEGEPLLLPVGELNVNDVGLDSVREFLTDYLSDN